MIYDVTASPLLTGAAARLDNPTLDAYASVAEAQLALDGPAVTDAVLVKKATAAVAIQVCHLVNLGTVDPYALTSESRGSRSVAYKGITVSPIAETLAAQVNAGRGTPAPGYDPDDWASLRSLRGECAPDPAAYTGYPGGLRGLAP